MRKMFNLAEVWGHRPDGTNPCRHVPMYPNGKATRLISDEEMGTLAVTRPSTPISWPNSTLISCIPVS